MRNRKPKVGNASVSLQEDSSIVIDVLANDFDRDGDVLIITALSDLANGTATLDADGTSPTPPILNSMASIPSPRRSTMGMAAPSRAGLL